MVKQQPPALAARSGKHHSIATASDNMNCANKVATHQATKAAKKTDRAFSPLDLNDTEVSNTAKGTNTTMADKTETTLSMQ
eukprot:6425547-Ditylum_brightwellii.AAC.1